MFEHIVAEKQQTTSLRTHVISAEHETLKKLHFFFVLQQPPASSHDSKVKSCITKLSISYYFLSLSL